jgi:transcriptional regulator with XRE-family HTH domain
MGLNERIKSLLTLSGQSPSELAYHCNVSQPSISRILNNKQEPRPDLIVKIAAYFNVSTDWLLTGEGPKEKAWHPGGFKIAEPQQAYTHPVVRKLAKLTPEEERVIINLIDLLLKNRPG